LAVAFTFGNPAGPKAVGCAAWCGAAVLGPILGTYAAAERWLPHRDGREAVLALILAVVCAGVVIGIRRALVPWHRRVMATIEPLQRDAATTIVRKTIRERLIAAHRKQR